MSRGWQLVVMDPSCLSGPVVAETTRAVARCVGARFAVVDEVEGGGEVRRQLVSQRLLVLSIEVLAGLAERMTQFEWGDFFLFRTEADASRLQQEDACPDRVLKSLVAIRCVDNTYFYLYGTDWSTREAILERLPVSESKEGEVCELDYPK